MKLHKVLQVSLEVFLIPISLLSLYSIEFPAMWILICLAIIKEPSHSSSEGLQL